MIERNLRLVEMVLIGYVLLTVQTITECRVVAIHAFTIHIIFHVLPSFNSQTIVGIALPVILWRSKSSKTQLMAVVDFL